jgi:adenylate cyclase
MAENKEPKERLAAILAADAVGYSRLMREDDRATVATLDEFRGLFRHSIETHNGRIVDMAGDSVLAIFESAISAVKSATEAQAELAKRNESLPEDRKMLFRVGLNLGDILEKDDGSIYGDGVNVAARLQAMASPGGINVSGTVFDSVRAKVGGPFAFMGEQELKNIADPVAVYQFGVAGQSRPANREPASKDGEAPPTVAVAPVKVISGGDEIASLAEGLQQDIIGGLTKQTAIAVIGEHAGDVAEAADFRLEGSVRAAGDRLRLSFTLAEGVGGSQVWSDRYDRNLDDVFDLEDEISMSVAAAVRIRIKAKAFEKLRNTVNDALSVPQLLSKAAGYF